MILFRGYMGSILHTGDFRFCAEMIEENDILFPKELRKNGSRLGISIPIDEMIFDNTYCNPMFNFPKADMAYKQMEKIISKNMGKKVFIAMSALGKEEICIKLAERFQTLIVLSEEKYRNMVILNIRPELFTTDPKEGWIEIISKRIREERMAAQAKISKNFICISIDFLMLEHRDPDGINFMVPFSLHSNYIEMESLIKAVRPCILKKLVLPYEKLPQFRMLPINNLKVYSAYLKHLKENGKSAYSELKKLFTDIFKLSENYKRWMNESSQAELLKKLNLEMKPDMNLRKRKINIEARSLEVLPHEEKKRTLEEIADHLKATHNNMNIKEFLETASEDSFAFSDFTKIEEADIDSKEENKAFEIKKINGVPSDLLKNKKIKEKDKPKAGKKKGFAGKRLLEEVEGKNIEKVVQKFFKTNNSEVKDEKSIARIQYENEEFNKKLNSVLGSFIDS